MPRPHSTPRTLSWRWTTSSHPRRVGLAPWSRLSSLAFSMSREVAVKERPSKGSKEAVSAAAVTAPPKKPSRRASSSAEKCVDSDPDFPTLIKKLGQLGLEGLDLKDVLGTGSYSIVIKGFRNASEKGKIEPVAVKVIGTRVQDEYVKRFLPREMKIVTNIRHPNIVRVHQVRDNRQAEDLPFVVFVTEWCEGGDLLKKIKKHKTPHSRGLPDGDMKLTFRQLADALDYLDKLQIVHRDLKCENIMLDKAENVKLGDFGFARTVTAEERSSTFCGSRAYVAPEVFKGEPYLPRQADVWSFGIVMFVTGTGLFPFDEHDHKRMIREQLEHKVPFPRAFRGPKEFKKLVMSCLHPMPEQRPSYQKIINSEWLKDTPLVIRK